MKSITGLLLVVISFSCLALSPEAEQGKTLYPACHVCHNPELDPPLGPPMYGVQRRYKRAYSTQEEFVAAMVDFVKHPEPDKVVMKEAVERLGVMQGMTLPDEMLKNIALYVYEETFDPPCKHWAMEIKRAEAAGDAAQHTQREKRNYKKFCQGKS